MKIATWNLAWPSHNRQQLAREHLESLDADVIVTTEDKLADWEAFPHRVDAGPDWGYGAEKLRRKVVMWSKTPWTDVRSHGDAMSGRFVAARTQGVDVWGVCIPWRDCHVSTGRKDSKQWDQHIRFCEQLSELQPTGPTMIAGDFNQKIPKASQPKRAVQSLLAALRGFEVVTAGLEEQAPTGRRQLIDHVATKGFAATGVETWPFELDDIKISDHSGVAADAHIIQ